MEPRMWTEQQLAVHLAVSIHTLRRKKKDLFAAGMPAPDNIIGRYDSVAIEEWLNSRMPKSKQQKKKVEDRAKMSGL